MTRYDNDSSIRSQGDRRHRRQSLCGSQLTMSGSFGAGIDLVGIAPAGLTAGHFMIGAVNPVA